jgi:hypothetical protein
VDNKGDLTCHKAGLVAQGFGQIKGVNYQTNCTSSPVVRMETNQLLLTLAAHYNLEVQTVNI